MGAADKALDNMTAGQTMGTKAPSGTCQCPGGRVRIGVFFDGTGNSYYRDWPHGVNDPEGGAGGVDPNKSNGPTNVAKLWKVFREEGTIQKRIYHHGVGTDSTVPATRAAGDPQDSTADAVNDTRGMLFGAGGKARVEWALKQLSVFFSGNNNHLATEKLIDSYGFSRGAAIARDFINTVETQRIDDTTRPNGQKYKVYGAGEEAMVVAEPAFFPHEHVIHEFLGAFDTVASFGLGGAQLGNDLAGYNFFINHKVVKRSVHMMAEDERRVLFPVSSFFVDPKDWFPQDRYQFKSVMQEVWYPGVHSDVGGSYLWRPGTPAVAEKTTKVFDEFGGSYDMTTPAVPAGPPKLPDLAHIPLHDMHKASVKAGVPLDPLTSLPAKLQQIDGKLADMYAKYCAYRSGREYDIGGVYVHNIQYAEFVIKFYGMRERSDAYVPLRDSYVHNENMLLLDGPHLQRKVLYMGPQPKDG